MIDATWATWPQIAERLERGPVLAVIAIGAQEQHGAHLPLSTDTVLSAELARRLAEGIDGLLLPPLPYGETWSTEGYAGTLSIGADTLQAIVTDIGRGLARNGVAGLIVVNGHFGNRDPITRAARALFVGGFRLLQLNYPGLERLAAELCESAPAAPTFYHGDEVETSMMLAIVPDRVDMTQAVSEYPVFPENFFNETIPLHHFDQSGVFGDPRPSTKAKGEAFLSKLHTENLRLARIFHEDILRARDVRMKEMK